MCITVGKMIHLSVIIYDRKAYNDNLMGANSAVDSDIIAIFAKQRYVFQKK
jgi:hypothetical protein